MPVNLPVGKGLDDMRRKNRLAIAESFARVVSEDARDDDRTLPLRENLDWEAEEDFWRSSVVWKVYISDDAQKARQYALLQERSTVSIVQSVVLR